jgi:hypothetical protein
MKRTVICFFLPALLSAQGNTASLSGIVVDPSDQIVPGALIKITQTATGVERRAESGDGGVFRISGLPVGFYSVTVEKDGFKPYILQALELLAGQEVTRRFRLQLSELRADIAVLDSIAEIERVSANGTRGTAFNPKEVANIPMFAGGTGRNYRVLAFQTPGVGAAMAAHAPFTVSGNRPIAAVNTMVDSAEYNDPVSGNLLGRGLTEQPVSMETVESMEMQTSNFKAEFGRATGAVVNLVTRQGTNAWHGSAYYFFQNEVLNARNPLLTDRAPLRVNMPGLTLGGPLLPNRWFFFGGYELNVRNAYRSSSTITTLTEAERALAAPAVRPFLQYFPLPNIAGTNLNSAAIPSPTTTPTGILRTDYQLTPSHRLMARANWVNAIGLTRDRLPAGDAETNNFSRSAVLSSDSALGLQWFHQARFTYSTFYSRVLPSNPSLGNPAINGQVGLLLITGLPRVGTFIPPTETRFHNYTVADDLTHTAGRHILKLGGIGRLIQYNSTSDRNFNGALVFPSVAAFLAAQPLTYSRAIGNSRIDQRNKELGVYIQDDWRVLRSLTLNLGLRYEYYGVPYEKYGRLTQTYIPDRNNLAPRFGFAWDILGRTKTVMRGGYGVFYAPLQLDFIAQSRFSPPLVTTFSRFRPTFPDLLAGATIGSDRYAVDGLLRNPYTQNWNLTVERELWNRDAVLSLGYVGNRGIRLPRSTRPNGGENLPPNLRPDPASGVVTYLTSGVSSTYHSLQAALRSRFGPWISLRATYTWSAAIDNASDTSLLPVDERNQRLDRARADFDQPHLLTLYALYDLPWAGKNRWLGGWQVVTLLFGRSGMPFSLLANANNPFGTLNNRINHLPGTIDRTRRGSQWFSLAPGVMPAQVVPTPGTVGTLGRNTERAPNYLDLSLSLQKSFLISERWRALFRAEAFNSLNRPNYELPINNLGNVLFGRILTAQDPRQVQLMLKLVF